jgi:hypothetical protein
MTQLALFNLLSDCRSGAPCWRSARTNGALALLNNFADPRTLRWDQSGDFVIMAVLGGMRSFRDRWSARRSLSPSKTMYRA